MLTFESSIITEALKVYDIETLWHQFSAPHCDSAPQDFVELCYSLEAAYTSRDKSLFIEALNALLEDLERKSKQAKNVPDKKLLLDVRHELLNFSKIYKYTVNKGRVYMSNALSQEDMDVKRFSPDIAILTVVGHEYQAVKAMLSPRQAGSFKISDQIFYGRTGLIERKNKPAIKVLLVQFDSGNSRAAALGAALLTEFSTLQQLWFVGIAGGVPNVNKVDKHLRLGDIVVPSMSGVLEFDYGDSFKCRPVPFPANQQAIRVQRFIEAENIDHWKQYLESAMVKEGMSYPNINTDVLHDSKETSLVLEHPHDPSRKQNTPKVFDGLIGSSNKVIKDPIERDRLRDEHEIIAVGMEDAGLATAVKTLNRDYYVVRAVCDYCDKHKNDDWHRYAAFVAASYAKVLLENI